MPYLTNADLPQSLRSHLPEHAQDIYRAAFNNAWDRYGDREPDRREEIAHRVAWSAVKKRYQKVDAAWVPRLDLDFQA
jgi:cation transport regulator